MKGVFFLMATIFYVIANLCSAQTYKSVIIGSQVWMVENLRVITFQNGDPIPEAKTNEEWKKAGQKGQPAWCWYENDSTNDTFYGKLYNWYAVNDPRGLAPKGWHLPSDGEWQALIDCLGGESVAGGKMKETGTAHWKSPNIGASNESGFFAVAGGLRYSDGEYNDKGDDAYFWSSTENGSDHVWYRIMGYYFSNIYRNYYDKRHGFSVRCIRD